MVRHGHLLRLGAQSPASLWGGLDGGRLSRGGPRGRVIGWTSESAGRLRTKLAALDHEALAGLVCIEMTRTVRRSPATAREWASAWNTLRGSMKRRGLVHYVDVLEWQLRRVPHAHSLLWFDPDAGVTGFELIGDWLRIASPWGPLRVGQDAAVARQESAVAEYMAKHGFRTAKHGQRDNAAAPAHWLAQGSVGRLWSASRGLPQHDEIRTRGLAVRQLEALRESLALRHGYLAFRRAVARGRDPVEARAKVEGSIREREIWKGLVLWERDDEWLAAAWQAARWGEVLEVPPTGSWHDLDEESQRAAVTMLFGERDAKEAA